MAVSTTLAPEQQQPAPFEPPKQIKYKRVSTPTLLQMEAVECGAAALGILLRHYKRFVPLEELRVKCGVSRDGSKLSHVAQAAREYGFIVKGLKKDLTELFDVKPPFIVFWNFNHFLVVEGFNKKGVYLNDPAMGPRMVSYEEFDAAYTGVILTLEPGPDFKKGGVPPSLLRSALSRMRGTWGALEFCFLAGLLMVVPGIIAPMFSKLFVDYVLGSKLEEFLLPLLGGMIFVGALSSALSYVKEHFLVRLENKLTLMMSAKFFWHVLKLPYTFFTQRYAGDIANRVNMNDSIATTLSSEVVGTAISLVLVVFYALIMLTYDVWLTAIGVAFSLLNLAALQFVSKKSVDINTRLSNETGKLVSTSINGLFTIETLKAGGAESDFFAKWAGVQAKVVNAQQEISVYSQIVTSIPTLVNVANTSVILAVGGLRVLNGDITMGTLVAFQGLMASFMEPFGSFLSLGSKLNAMQANLTRIDDVLDYPKEPPKKANEEVDPNKVQKLTGEIEFRNVTFGYNILEPPLIENFSLKVKPGGRVAIVGASGSGKSTTANLVSGLYKPWSGEILLDGKPASEIPDMVLAASIAMVNQDIFLFEGTVKDNITMWDNSIPHNVIVQAAKDAVIHDDIETRPGGYDGVVEEGGRNFSGGQRQRIEIARALTYQPTILVMDEATSALDPETEKLIDGAVRRRGCTCIIVAHRLSTIRDSDEIIVLENGKVVERGTHESMKDAGGPYSKLIASY
jgi:NHLM bacteriocin system ABC transporter peptidase/ATP-binding protein